MAKGARLRRVKNVNADRLAPAIHAGIRIAEAIARNIKDPQKGINPPPRDPREWRTALLAKYKKVDLEAISSDLWSRGIIVVHVEDLPSPKYQGLACIVMGRPAVVLGHAHDAPPRLAFFISHEAAHILNGDCAPDAAIVDEDDEVIDNSDIEAKADAFAVAMLSAGVELTQIGADTTPKDIARLAVGVSAQHKVDPGGLIWAWANRTRRFQDGQLALRALYRHQGGQRVLRGLFDQFVDLRRASETDVNLLELVSGAVKRDAPTAR